MVQNSIIAYVKISIHAPAKGATQSKKVPPSITGISIHAPAKGATTSFWRIGYLVIYFNPRSREGSDMVSRPYLYAYSYFNPRSREGSDSGNLRLRTSSDYFNPRSREGSDIVGSNIVTVPADFNPRSREGSDGIPVMWQTAARLFQSTLPRRERHCCSNLLPMSRKISIHAPAKGATCLSERRGEESDISIHAPAKGATEICRQFICDSEFQSTLPRRERPSNGISYLTARDFNPRSREGSDTGILNCINHAVISIHAPAKGATHCRLFINNSFDYFNPRSREGSDG